MRLVWVTPSPPYPPDEGAQLVAFNRISRLDKRGHEVHVLAPVDGHVTERERQMQEYCTTLTCCPTDGALLEQLRKPWIPHLTAGLRSKALQTQLNELVETGVDTVFVEYTPMSEYARGCDAPTCVGVHNIEYRLIAGMAEDIFPSPVAAGYAIEAARLFRYESAAYREEWADAYAFLSQDERRTITDRYPSLAARTFDSPVGVDVSRFEGIRPPDSYPTDQPVIVFTGSMSYRPNVDAVCWFVDSILPHVREQFPGATFFIAGKDPVPSVQELSNRPGVTVTGSVERIEPYLVGADVFVGPLRRGGGVKIKLLEALASARPVVTTSIGLRGTALSGGDHVFLADDPKRFATRVCEALEDPKRDAICENGHRFVRENYSWETVIDRLETVLRTLSDQR